nr:MAG TPA: hypothetical protein [Caudoviricetes sp.]
MFSSLSYTRETTFLPLLCPPFCFSLHLYGIDLK